MSAIYKRTNPTKPARAGDDSGCLWRLFTLAHGDAKHNATLCEKLYDRRYCFRLLFHVNHLQN